jgi:hypothetical protein
VETDQRKDLKLNPLSKKGSMKPKLALFEPVLCVKEGHTLLLFDMMSKGT